VSAGSLKQKIKARIRRLANRFAAPERVFTAIYRDNVWGGAAGEPCSGGGSTDAAAVEGYLGMFRSEAERLGFATMSVVDLGCGDMRIGERLIPFCGSYTGVDVVEFLVRDHQSRLGSEKIRFLHLDAVADELPAGDVCLVRQVFQHLSNRQVSRILGKLGAYRYIYITEHVPSPGVAKAPNRDKPAGAGIRLSHGSGIELTAPPFGIPLGKVRVVLEVPGNPTGCGGDPGVIRTVLYEPGGGGK
jgi:hypothetical protein